MTGRLVLVTGGNRGIGLEICKQLVKSGDRVLLTSRKVQAGVDAAQTIEKETGVKGSCEVLPFDAANPTSVDELVGAVAVKYKDKINGLIHNAAVLVAGAWDAESFEHTKAVNYTTPVVLTTKMVPHLAQGCRVTMVSSGYGQLNEIPEGSWYLSALNSAKTLEDLQSFQYLPDDPMKKAPHCPTYKLSKAMLNRATQFLSKDEALSAKSITVNAVCPGWCRTEMGGASATRSAQKGADSILWVMNHPDPARNGTFTRDGEIIGW